MYFYALVPVGGWRAAAQFSAFARGDYNGVSDEGNSPDRKSTAG